MLSSHFGHIYHNLAILPVAVKIDSQIYLRLSVWTQQKFASEFRFEFFPQIFVISSEK